MPEWVAGFKLGRHYHYLVEDGQVLAYLCRLHEREFVRGLKYQLALPDGRFRYAGQTLPEAKAELVEALTDPEAGFQRDREACEQRQRQIKGLVDGLPDFNGRSA